MGHPTTQRRERLIIPLGLWSFPVDEKPIFPFFVEWALQGGASKPRPSNLLSTGIVDWAGLVFSFVDWTGAEPPSTLFVITILDWCRTAFNSDPVNDI